MNTPTAPLLSRQWNLHRRPLGRTIADDLICTTVPVAQLAQDEILIRVKLLCMDPTIRNFMDEDPGYGLPIPLGGVVRGMIIGEVMSSKAEQVVPGTMVWGFGSWSDYVVGPARQFFALPTPLAYDLPVYAHAMGTIGLTAYYGMFDIAALRAGDQVLVSGAAGAVGSLAGQFARLGGAGKVVGIAGGAEKCLRAVRDYGYDLCIDYKQLDSLSSSLKAAFPNGIDVIFENVGGAQLSLALQYLNKHARVALCGMIDGYGNHDRQPSKDALWNLVIKSARLEGFLVSNILNHKHRTDAMLAQIHQWITSGSLRYDLDVRFGFACIPRTFDCLFSGQHRGRLVVQLDDALPSCQL